MGRLVILSGPSCIGKSPLLKAVQRFYPDLASQLRTLVLYNDRQPRPGEQDGMAYHFRPRPVIEELRQQPGYLVMKVRRDLQALEMAQVQHVLDSGQDAFFEGNVYMAQVLLDAPQLQHIPKVSCFLSPLALEEVRYLQAEPHADLREIVTDVIRRKLLRRVQQQKSVLSAFDLHDIEARCRAAYRELSAASRCDWVLPNHDGEDSDSWDAFYYPLGDARKCLLDFVAILTGGEPTYAEKWPPDLFADEKSSRTL